MAKFDGVVIAKLNGKVVSSKGVSQHTWSGFEGALRDAAGQAAYELAQAAGVPTEQIPDPQQPDVR